MKCANAVCLNEASGLKKMRGNFCMSCLKSTTPYTFNCIVCESIFTHTTSRLSRIPLACSVKCKNKRKYENGGREWAKKHNITRPRAKVKPIAKLCFMCDEAFKCFKRGKFCSRSCSAKYDRKYNAMARLYKHTKTMVAQRLNSQDIYNTEVSN
jgi:hypothetical protein